MIITLSNEPSDNPLPLQGEGQGGGQNGGGGVTRHASQKTIHQAKSLRGNLTEVEKRLWQQLRAKRFAHYKFRRQHAVARYIADFVCLKSKLIIELDGGQHGNFKHAEHDKKRTESLESQGFRILRFWNNEVTGNMEGVLQTIFDTLSPSLSLKGEGVKGNYE